MIGRARLQDQLERIFSARAGLVIGPSGSGVSTLLRSWSSSTTCGEVVWITVGRTHCDATVLIEELAEAVQCAVGEHVAMHGTQAVRAVDRIADAIDRSGRRVVIVLDDAQLLVGAESIEVVRRLLSLDRRSLRVVIAGRETPEFGWEVLSGRGGLLVIGAGDLRLDDCETAAIVRSVSGVDIDDVALASVHDHIDGWAAGAVLAGLVLRGSNNGMLETETAIDHHPLFTRFFSTKVFDSLPTDIQEFLLDTCVLDVLEPGPCAELSRREDAEDVLWSLERSNTFTSWIGGDPSQFRYHPVLCSFLRRRLEHVDPARALDLERRAASWFEAQGRSGEAIEHRLAAEDYEVAAGLITEYGPRALGEGRYEAIRGWICSLPEPLRTSDASLLVLLTEVEHRMGNNESTTALRAILRDRVGQHAGSPGLDQLEFGAVVQRGTELVVRGRLDAAAVEARRALSMIDLGSWSIAGDQLRFEELLRAMDLASVGDKLMYAGDFAQSRRVSKWVVEKLPPDDPRAAAVRTRCLGQLAVCELVDGTRFAAEELALEAIALCRFHELDPIELGYAELGLLVAGRQVDRAALHAVLERRISQLNVPAITCLVDLLRSWSYVQSDDSARARELLASGQRSLATLDEPGMLARLARRVGAMVEAGSDEALLSERQTALLALLAGGLSRRSAADQLHVSLNTIKTHLRLAYRSLGVSTLEAAVERCQDLGITLSSPIEEAGVAEPGPRSAH